MKRPVYRRAIVQNRRLFFKTVLIMKLITILLFATSLQLCASGVAQKVSLHIQDAKIEDVFTEIQKQTGYDFVYDKSWLQVSKKISLRVNAANLQEVLDLSCKGQPFTFLIKDRTVVLRPRTAYQPEEVSNFLAAAAPQEVEGVIKDSTGRPIEGATVTVTPGNFMAQTNASGSFRFPKVNAGNYRLTVTYIGYKTLVKEIAVSSSSLYITFQLEQDIKSIADFSVVSTGYQALPRERATGSFGIVSKDQLDKPTSNISSRLIGAVAGLQARSLDVDGVPRFELRGQTTLTASAGSAPMVVVDGFPVEGDFNSINPNDVESISVLKDAAAASIWGARAANGVIVITTKNARKGMPAKVEFSSFVRVAPKMDLDYVRAFASSAETVDYEKRAFNKWGGSLNNGSLTNVNTQYQWGDASVAMNEQYLGFLTVTQRDALLEQLKTRDNKKQIRDELLANPLTQQYNLLIQGSTAKMMNSLSLLYENSQTNFRESNLKKYMVNYRTQVNLTPWLDFNFSAFTQYIDSANNGTTLDELKYMAPYEMLNNDDGSLTNISQFYWPIMTRSVLAASFPYRWTYNPIEEIQNRNLSSKQLNTRVQAGFSARIIKGLTVETKLQYELFNTFKRYLYNENTLFVRKLVNTYASWNGNIATAPVLNIPKGNILNESRIKAENYVFRNMVHFNRDFAGRHRIDLVAGAEMQDFLTTGNTSPTAYGYNDNTLTVSNLPNGPGGTPNGSGGTYQLRNFMGVNLAPIAYINSYSYQASRYFSAFANLSYTYQDKYTLSGSYRTDASNLITDDPKFRYDPFWSAGASWYLSRERFFKAAFVDRLSLRATFGYNGNVDRSTSFVPLLNMLTAPNAYTNEFTASVSSFGNPSLRWEKTGTINVGIDYSLFKSKLSGHIDLYRKKGKDLLAQVTIPSVNGTALQKINAASMVNKGIELEMGTSLPVSKNVSWRGSLTASYNFNQITSLYVATYEGFRMVNAGTYAYVEGYNANQLWSYQYAGIQNSQPVVKGENGATYPITNWPLGDGRNYMLAAGTAVAPYTLGFINSFKAYDFDFSFIVTGKFGHKFRRTGFNYPSSASGSRVRPNNKIGEVLSGDQQEIIPLPLNDNDSRYFFWANYYPYMDYLIANASHIRLQEVNVTYNAGKHLRKAGLKNALVFAQGNNLLLIKANKNGEDPEYPLGGLRPQPSYTFGIKLEL